MFILLTAVIAVKDVEVVVVAQQSVYAMRKHIYHT